MSRTSRALKGTLTSFLQYGLQIVLQAALVPLVLHIAGRETLGAYAILMQAIGYLALADLGFSVATNRFLAQAYGHDDGGLRFRQGMSRESRGSASASWGTDRRHTPGWNFRVPS